MPMLGETFTSLHKERRSTSGRADQLIAHLRHRQLLYAREGRVTESARCAEWVAMLRKAISQAEALARPKAG